MTTLIRPGVSGPLTARIGDALPVLEHSPTNLELFRYSAATSNTHRIHFDAAYAQSEGYPDVLVHSHLQGAYLIAVVSRWIENDEVALSSVSVRVHRYATPGQRLVFSGQVADLDDLGDQRIIEVRLQGHRLDDEALCATGSATVLVRAPKPSGREGGFPWVDTEASDHDEP